MAKIIEIKKVLELNSNNISQNSMEKNFHISKKSSRKILLRAKELNVSYEDVKDIAYDELVMIFFPEIENKQKLYGKPDYEKCQKELVKTGVTLKLLWQEYCDVCESKGLMHFWYGKFCKDYHEYVGINNVTNHLIHKPGQKIEVDWSGKTMRITDEITGTKYKAYLFVATLPYSQYSYVEATLNMKQSTWINCNVNMFNFIGGVTRTVVCDNLKTGVIKHPKEGDIIINKQYEEFSNHYCTAIMPAPVKTPKKKASVEGTVGKVATKVIAELRNEEFNSINALNAAISKKLSEFNNKKFQKKYDGKYSRSEVFNGYEKEYLNLLPFMPYEYGEWILHRKVGLNAHIQYKKNFYSCNYKYIGKNVDIKITKNLLKIFFKNTHLVSHPLFPEYQTYQYSTRKQDLPDYFNGIEWNYDNIIEWSNKIGPHTLKVVEAIFSSVKVREQGYNPSLSILRLSKKHTKQEFELACEYALNKLSSPRYKDIKAVLHSQVINTLINKTEEEDNQKRGIMRGADYFKRKTSEIK